MTAGISRADLLRVLKELGPGGLEYSASALGYYRRGKRKPVREPEPLPLLKTAAPGDSVSEPREEHRFESGEPGVVFWRAESFTVLPSDESIDNKPGWWEAEAEISEADEAGDKTKPLPPRLPLVPWSRLWPFLFAALGRMCDSRRVNLDRVLDYFCRVKPIKRLPYVPRLTWAGQGQLLVDVHETLTPFWDDSGGVLRRIARIRGMGGLEVSVFENMPEDGCRGWTPKRGMGELKPYALPVPGAPVLAVSDLGCLDPDRERKMSWLRLGKRLKSAGFNPVALLPCPPRLWDPGLAEYWTMVCWDRGFTVPRSPETAVKPADYRPPGAVDREKGMAMLLAMMGAAVRVEPVLLRALRLMLPRMQADAGTEALAWQHADLNRSPVACGFKPDAAVMYRERFYELPPGMRRAVKEIVRRYHAGLPGSVRAEEETVAAEAAGEQYWRRVLKTGINGTFPKSLGEWVDRVFGRMHKNQFSGCPVLNPLWLARNIEEWKSGRVIVPEGFDLQKAVWVLGKGRPVDIRLAQRGTEFTTSKEEGGSPLVDLHLKNGRLVVDMEYEKERRGYNLEEDRAVSFPAPGDGWVRLETEGARVELAARNKPRWASAIGRDRFGIFAEIGEGEAKRTVYWLPPGQYPVHVSPGTRLTYTISKGVWWDERECLGVLREGFVKPAWADTLGVGEYGIYADFSVKRVKQRMRLILPGEFKMGSPEGEIQRENDENIHDVILTEGFWLADTTCTQELWKAVTGKKPSRFKGDQRPVEKVSWDDCKTFFKKVKKLKPGLELSFPSEAQWEYACRAGTETPFSFGKNITTEQVNYHGEYPYADGQKGEYRGETVDVKSLPCNKWGLYQMHGNVWEWCADWFGDYSTDLVINPTGPNEGGYRVCRGGSWFSNGRIVRSAYRDWLEPSFADSDLGFRFSQVFSSPASPGGPGSGKSPLEQLERSGNGDIGRRS